MNGNTDDSQFCCDSCRNIFHINLLKRVDYVDGQFCPECAGKLKIEWTREELIDTHDQMKEYACSGKDGDGREYIGTWWQIDSEFDSITDVEQL